MDVMPKLTAALESLTLAVARMNALKAQELELLAAARKEVKPLEPKYIVFIHHTSSYSRQEAYTMKDVYAIISGLMTEAKEAERTNINISIEIKKGVN